MRKTLTAAACAAAIDEAITTGRKVVAFDTAITGFVIECQPSGSATYALKYVDPHGSQRQRKIAGYKDITFDRAKREAVRLRSEVVLGRDPSAEKAEKKAVPLFETVANDHIEHARTYMKSIKTLEGYMKRIKARWGKLRLTDIRSQDIAAWTAELRDEGLSPATILKILMFMHKSFELAARWNIPGAERNPVKSVPKPKVANSRQTYIDADQTARLMAAASRSQNPQLPSIIALLLATGMRITECLSTRWSDVDLDRKSLFIPMSKNGRSRTLPLSSAAVEIIRKIQRNTGSEFLFPNPSDPTKRLTTIKHSWHTARSEAGMPELRVHDLRHSFASAAVSAGIDIYHVSQLMGHRNLASTVRYSHVANKTLMAAVEAGASMLNLAAIA